MVRRRTLGVALAVAMVAIGPTPEAAARKPRKILRATVGGRRLKPSRGTVALSAGGGTIGFLAAGTKVAHSLHGVSKLLTVACGNDLSVQTFPFVTTDCLASYTETRARPASSRVWTDLVLGNTQVTFDTYEPGVRISGGFHSVIPPGPSNPELSPIALDGRFSGPVALGDSNR